MQTASPLLEQKKREVIQDHLKLKVFMVNLLPEYLTRFEVRVSCEATFEEIDDTARSIDIINKFPACIVSLNSSR